MRDDIQVRSLAQEGRCPLCGSDSTVVHPDVTDMLYGVPGTWDHRRCADPNCGLVWLDPVPAEDVLPTFYLNYYTHEVSNPGLPDNGPRGRLWRSRVNYAKWRLGYARQGRGDRWLALMRPTQFAAELRSLLYLRAAELGRLLDVGCGSGDNMLRLRSLGWEVQGIDFDVLAIDVARQRGLLAICGDIQCAGLAPEQFDVVISSHVIEHVPNPRAFFAACNRLLKPGGRLVLFTPNPLSFGHRLFGRSWRGLEPPRHLHLFPSDALRRLAQEQGMQQIQVLPGYMHGYTLWASAALRFGRPLAARPEFQVRSRMGIVVLGLLQLLELALRGLVPGRAEEIMLSAIKFAGPNVSGNSEP